MDKNKKALKAAFPNTIPVMMGYIFMGMAFGILLQSKGYHFVWAFFMSIVIYAGSMQFVAVELLASGATLITSALMTFMVNVRHVFYGLALLEKFEDMGKYKPYLIFSLTDETFSLHCATRAPEGVDEKRFSFFIAFLDQIYWICGCTFGALIGGLFTINTKGIDFAMTALFVVIFVDQWRGGNARLSAILGVAASIVCLLLFGPDNFILPSMITIVLIFTLLRKTVEKGEGNR